MKVDDAPDEIAKVYEINSLEQLRAMADQLRLSILQRLLGRAMTVTQLGEALGIAPAKAHYHVRELERVGLVRLVQTREKGGILEKYYRAVAEDIQVPRSLLSSAPTDEALAALGKIFALASGDAERGTSAAPSRSNAPAAGTTYYSRADLEWLVASGIEVDVVVPGACSFADDVTPTLVERAIKSFHCRGPLSASPEVRQVLARKASRAPSS